MAGTSADLTRSGDATTRIDLPQASAREYMSEKESDVVSDCASPVPLPLSRVIEYYPTPSRASWPRRELTTPF
jgi:hypothetical protein